MIKKNRNSCSDEEIIHSNKNFVKWKMLFLEKRWQIQLY